MLKTILIDDETRCLEALAIELNEYCPQVKIIDKCTSAKDGLLSIKKNKPDLIFLDIEMPWMNGFEMLDVIEEIDFEIIFVTAYDKFAVRAFRVSAMDYILKPAGQKELKEAVDKVLEKKSDYISKDHLQTLLENIKNPSSANPKVAFPKKDGIEFIACLDVIHCQADDNYCHLILQGAKNVLLAKSIKHIEGMLKDYGFFRIHQSHLINLSHLKTFMKSDGGYVIMDNGDQLRVSRLKKEELLEVVKNI